MILTELFGLFSLSAFTMWGFLMTFFFNVFVYSLDLKRGTTLLLSSFIMMISYTLSDYFYTWLSIKNSIYLDWALYDISTILALICIYKITEKTTPSFLYLIVGLSINSIFFFCMYLDMYIFGNMERWFFWDVYTYAVNLMDLIMIVALIVDRDFLGLHKLKNKTLSYFKSNDTHKLT
ncbi:MULTISPECIES: hypothetical protein [Pseudoalteromonas]|uniref:Membrane protein triplicated sequence n=1 Tax=Pseudoalteromonas fuliginea TaxID=1872678 RepID=A0ABD3Y741_9GAMM|nr:MULTISPECIES: hypothetical protein [Pseudoalteromonas]ALQ09057.1 hypothetical protein D172_013945 [Pseudoalteromonas sp. Bsw20308]KDC49884.1 hypothetical protein DC53_14945 [Pseudoalteromonas fuliginea]KJZ27388.1 hypothetical protein TW82_12400 [Pseudoalteromonas fuliginea]MDQ2045476.1 hypothetical protein [Pseudoalteromonas sp. 20-92]